MKTFANKTAVITGAGSGIGRALAKSLAKSGARLAISDINTDSLEETAKLIRAEVAGLKDEDLLLSKLDVSDKAAFSSYAEEVIQKFGGVDLVFNNAGVAVAGYFEEVPLEDFEWLMGINFWGVVYGSRFFLPALKKSPEAALVNISSIFGIVGMPTQSAYNAAKFAVRGFTEALRTEYADTNIQIHTVHPGGVKTSIASSARYHSSWREGMTHEDAKELFEKIAGTTPEEAAEIILGGVRKNESRILVGRDAVVMDLIARTLPENYSSVFRFLERMLT